MSSGMTWHSWPSRRFFPRQFFPGRFFPKIHEHRSFSENHVESIDYGVEIEIFEYFAEFER